MSTEVSAFASGQFLVGGDIAVNRLGFGAMRISRVSHLVENVAAAQLNLSEDDFAALAEQGR